MKEKSLFRKMIEVFHEERKRKRAIKLLQKQEWSFDFLSLLLVKAGKMLGTALDMEITDKNGIKYKITYNQALVNNKVNELGDSIFNHLDDDNAINEFIALNSVR